MKNLTCLLLSLLCLYCLPSCKKDKKEEPKPTGCKISRTIEYENVPTNNPDTSYYEYNNDKIKSITRTKKALFNAYTSTFEYYGSNMIKIFTQVVGNGKYLSDSVTLNNNGQIVYKYHVLDLFYHTSCEYNAAGEITKATTLYADPTLTDNTQTYEWHDGCIVKTKNSEGDTVFYDYYTDISYKNTEKAYVLDYLDYGIVSNRSKNLKKSATIQNNNYTVNYSYEFDSEQRLTKVTEAQGSSKSITEIQYSCH